MQKTDWNEVAKEHLKTELSKKRISHADLVGYLSAIGVKETKASIDSKISRGTFSASFLLQCLSAIGSNKIENKMIQEKVIALHPVAKSTNNSIYFEDSRSRTRYLDTRQEYLAPSFTNDLTVISLFSGAGGIDIGLEEVGYQTLVCVDNELDCRITLKHNRPDWVVFDSTTKKSGKKTIERAAGDIRDIAPEELLEAAGRKKGEVTLIAGGAPCQPFSNIGKKQGKNDARNGDLFLEFVKMVKGIEPQAFIFENVTGITQKKHAKIIDYMKEQFSDMDYGISHTILNAANYGVSQRRERFFLIGIKRAENPAFPLPTHYRDQASWDTFVRYFDAEPTPPPWPWVSVKELFSGLPKNYKKRGDYAVMNISDVVKERMKFIKQGENFKVLPMEYRPNCWKNGKHLGSDTFGRLVEDLPSVTIRTAAYNPSKGRYIHPKEDRGLNTIEMAGIQGFPYDWEFKSFNREKVTLVSAGKQIGNAVPPPLAQALGKAIAIQIQEQQAEITEFEKIPLALSERH